MQPIDVQKASAELAQLQEQAARSALEPSLVALVCLRVSQISGCAVFVDLHVAAAQTAGESEQRLGALALWHHSPLFTQRERAALEWSEAVTQVAHSHIPDEAWKRLLSQLAPAEIVDLTVLAAQCRVPDELWLRLTPELTQQEIDDLTYLVTVVSTRNRLAMACSQNPV